MKSLFNSVLETAMLFRKCNGYSQSIILKEECAELIGEVTKKYNKYHLESEVKTMKEIKIEITLTDDNITLDGKNLIDLSDDDIINSIKMLVSLAKTLNIYRKEVQ